jgi:predicted membrane protein
MEKKKIRFLIEVLLMVIMFSAWLTMLYGGIQHSFLIFLVATIFFAVISRKNTLIERLGMGMIIFGMFSLCQPFTIVLYQCGFQTILTGTLAFIVVSHKHIPKHEIGGR